MRTNGIELHVATAGPADGELVVLLHGFPELWYGWRHQIPALADRGFRVLAPDQRGYNTSDKPEGVDAYNVDLLADDIAGLVAAAGRKTACIAGHDWGGVVAWHLAATRPDLVSKVAVCNVPALPVMWRNLRTNPKQMAKSWYTAFFQLPKLPEKLILDQEGRRFGKIIQRDALPGSITDEDLEVYRASWLQPGCPTGMINWYRAGLRSPPRRMATRKIQPPALLIWGRRDTALAPELAEQTIAICERGRLVYLDVSHWVQLDAPARVSELLLEHFTAT